jgi:hypothetical protein
MQLVCRLLFANITKRLTGKCYPYILAKLRFIVIHLAFYRWVKDWGLSLVDARELYKLILEAVGEDNQSTLSLVFLLKVLYNITC